MFVIQRGNSSREQIAIINGSRKLGLTWHTSDYCPSDGIPIGDVPFCESVFGRQPHLKNFFPNFISARYLSRDIRLVDNPAVTRPQFYKCATEWKSASESGVRCTVDSSMQLCGQWYVSDVVTFTQEWRYYVADGELVTTGWYSGDNEDEPAPELDIAWPGGFSGAVDFGRLDNGRIELVEAHAPFACGWYGDRHEDYALWQYMAWQNRQDWIEYDDMRELMFTKARNVERVNYRDFRQQAETVACPPIKEWFEEINGLWARLRVHETAEDPIVFEENK